MRRLVAMLFIPAWLVCAVLPSGTTAGTADDLQATAPLASRAADVDDYIAWLQQQMRKMDAVLARIRATEEQGERRVLMREYAVALEVTNALTRAVDPYLSPRGDPAEEMSCAMMGAKKKAGAAAGAPSAAAPAAETPPEGHEAHH